MYRYEGEPSEELGPFVITYHDDIFSPGEGVSTYRLIEKHISLDFLLTRVKIRSESEHALGKQYLDILLFSGILNTAEATSLGTFVIRCHDDVF
jgi:hypothetical protein